MKLSKPIVVQGPGRAEGKAEDQIVNNAVETAIVIALSIYGCMSTAAHV